MQFRVRYHQRPAPSQLDIIRIFLRVDPLRRLRAADWVLFVRTSGPYTRRESSNIRIMVPLDRNLQPRTRRNDSSVSCMRLHTLFLALDGGGKRYMYTQNIICLLYFISATIFEQSHQAHTSTSRRNLNYIVAPPHSSYDFSGSSVGYARVPLSCSLSQSLSYSGSDDRTI